MKQAQGLAAQSAEKAKTIFYEKIAPPSQCPIPEAKNFVKFDSSCEETLNIIPAMNEVLRYIIPPQVRRMQGEFKT